MVMRKIKITLASDDGVATAACSELLDRHAAIEVVASLDDLTGHGAWLAMAQSDVLLIDESLLSRGGFEPLNMLLSTYPEVHCLLILESTCENKALWALMQGVRGVLTIREIRPLLIRAITEIVAGEIWAPRTLMQPIRRDLREVDDGSYAYCHPERIKEWVKWH
jgi:DNA-binding NarL/FixJ family response regulator